MDDVGTASATAIINTLLQSFGQPPIADVDAADVTVPIAERPTADMDVVEEVEASAADDGSINNERIATVKGAVGGAVYRYTHDSPHSTDGALNKKQLAYEANISDGAKLSAVVLDNLANAKRISHTYVRNVLNAKDASIVKYVLYGAGANDVSFAVVSLLGADVAKMDFLSSVMGQGRGAALQRVMEQDLREHFGIRTLLTDASGPELAGYYIGQGYALGEPSAPATLLLRRTGTLPSAAAVVKSVHVRGLDDARDPNHVAIAVLYTAQPGGDVRSARRGGAVTAAVYAEAERLGKSGAPFKDAAAFVAALKAATGKAPFEADVWSVRTKAPTPGKAGTDAVVPYEIDMFKNL